MYIFFGVGKVAELSGEGKEGLFGIRMG